MTPPQVDSRRRRPQTQLQSQAYITNDDSGPEAAIHRRRRHAMISLLAEFERTIEPLLPPGSDKAIKHFKGVCRKKINGLAFEGLRAAKAQPGESVSTATADLAEELAFDDPEGN